MNILLGFISTAVAKGTVLAFGTLGEILTEKSGNLNLGVEGMMFMGGSAGLAGLYIYDKFASNPITIVAVLIAIIFAFLAAMLGALIYSFLTVTLKANQNVTGLALTIFGVGFGNSLGVSLGNFNASDQVKKAFQAGIPKLQEIPYVGKILFSYSFMVYLSIALSLIIAWFLKRTRKGLNLRAVGENPQTADAAGINVSLNKYLATCIGGGITGLGGLYFVMLYSGGCWRENCLDGWGWLSVALVIFVLWKPSLATAGAILFGALCVTQSYYSYIPLMDKIPKEFYQMLPYVATILVLVISSIRNKRENQPPASLGVSYFREER